MVGKSQVGLLELSHLREGPLLVQVEVDLSQLLGFELGLVDQVAIVRRNGVRLLHLRRLHLRRVVHHSHRVLLIDVLANAVVEGQLGPVGVNSLYQFVNPFVFVRVEAVLQGLRQVGRLGLRLASILSCVAVRVLCQNARKRAPNGLSPQRQSLRKRLRYIKILLLQSPAHLTVLNHSRQLHFLRVPAPEPLRLLSVVVPPALVAVRPLRAA